MSTVLLTGAAGTIGTLPGETWWRGDVAALTVPPDVDVVVHLAANARPGFGTFLISSRNSRSRWDATEDEQLLGYAPQDDAEAYADLAGNVTSQQDCFRGTVANRHSPPR
ncbi:hypothetical protein [Catenuloplanes indicus]|uniref:Uncharacterized protein n=1 Tax=Catenuloplanes indicus TaxID=137267 RepID=A0AAE4AVQ0_9ACTN|nr:hypothetical protein [Catenuloplanes indicus]MDQ0364204.1 hypothetical protein [Catenuloplanes indicus]